MASTSFAHLSKQVLVKELDKKSIEETQVLDIVEEEGDTWMTLIYEYLTKDLLPAEQKKANAIKMKSQRFAVIKEILYKKSFLGPWHARRNQIRGGKGSKNRVLLANKA